MTRRAKLGFCLRALVILMVCICTFGLVMADLVSHSYGAAPLAAGHRAWMAAQGGLGLLLAVFATVHVAVTPASW